MNLRSAADFGVLAGTMVSNSNTVGTEVIGDIGVSPATAVNGFPPGVVYGDIYRGGVVATQAQADLALAYADAAGRTGKATTVSGNIGGRTLVPGLYNSTSSLAISSGDLTLDGQGNPDAVFLFQVGSSLTTTADRRIILIRGARASHVYWQVGSSATIGVRSFFAGTIMAAGSITMETDARIDGRALAQSGTVSIDVGTVNSKSDEISNWQVY